MRMGGNSLKSGFAPFPEFLKKKNGFPIKWKAILDKGKSSFLNRELDNQRKINQVFH